MSERAAYSRVYWSIIDDPKFANVYDDDRALATWLRLLLVADQAWPASAHIPTGTHPKALAVLVGAGLVEVGAVKVEDGAGKVDVRAGRRYRIHGLDAERERRKDAATRQPAKRDPSGTQAGPKRDPNGPGTTGLRRDEKETRRDEPTRATSDDPYDETADPYDEAVKWLASRQAWVDSPKISTDLARMVDRKGAPVVIAAMAGVPGAETAAQYVYGARNALFPLPGTQTVSKEDREAQDRAARRAALGLEALS